MTKRATGKTSRAILEALGTLSGGMDVLLVVDGPGMEARSVADTIVQVVEALRWGDFIIRENALSFRTKNLYTLRVVSSNASERELEDRARGMRFMLVKDGGEA